MQKKNHSNKKIMRRVLAFLCALVIVLTSVNLPGIAQANTDSVSEEAGSSAEPVSGNLESGDGAAADSSEQNNAAGTAQFSSDQEESETKGEAAAAGSSGSGNAAGTATVESSENDSSFNGTVTSGNSDENAANESGNGSTVTEDNSSAASDHAGNGDGNTEAESGTVKKSVKLTANGTDLTVTAEADSSVIPENAALSVTPIRAHQKETKKAYASIKKRLSADAKSNKKSLSGFYAYDIRFVTEENGKEETVEPENGTVRLTMQWGESVAPKDADPDSVISVIHFLTDLDHENKIKSASAVNLTGSTASAAPGNYAALTSDSSSNISEATIKVDSLSVFAFAWEKDTDTSNNAVSEAASAASGTESAAFSTKSSSNTSNDAISEADSAASSTTSSDSESRAASSEEDTWDADKDAADGTASGENSASKGNIDSNSGSSNRNVKESGSTVAESKADTKEKDAKKEIESTDSSGTYTVTVTYDSSDEKLTDLSSLSVRELTEDSDEYESAKEKILAFRTDLDETAKEQLGFSALDISLLDQDGNEIEPNDSVHVKITMNRLPDGVEDGDELRVDHIKDENKPTSGNVIIRTLSRAVRTMAAGVRSFYAGNDGSVEKIADAKAEDRTAVAEGDVASFSVFTITWSKTANDKTRVGNVNVHYTSATGAELTERPDSTPAANLVAGTSTSMADWAKDATTNKTHLAGYTYVGARIEKSDGEKITDVQVVQNADNTYSLQYKKEGESTWTTYKDSVSGKNENNVDIYLLFSKNPSITVHYVDESGNDLNDDETDTKNAEDLTTATAVSGWAKTITDYTIRTTNPAHIGSPSGTAITSVKAVKNSDETYTLQYQYGTDGVWRDMTDTDIYLVYDKSTFIKEVKIHFVDVAGVPITDANGTAVTKSIDAADWTSSDYVKADANGNQYVDLSKWADTFDGYAAWNSSSINAGDADGCGLKYADNSSSATTRGAVTGRNFRFIRYSSSDGKIYVGRGALRDNTVTAGEEITGNVDIYMFYRQAFRIHYVDKNGTELYDTFSKEGVIKNQSSYNTYDLTSTDAQNSHGTPKAIYDKLPTDNSKTEISSIAWKYDSGWKTQITPKDGDATESSGLIKDVYMVYDVSTEHSVTVHHIDTDGNAIGTDQTKTISTSPTTLTASSTTDFTAPANYTPTGNGYIGYTDNSNKGITFTSMTFKEDLDTNTWSNTYTNSETTDGTIGLANEIWIEYQKSSTQYPVFHYVDENGTKLADDYVLTGLAISTAGAYTTWNGTGTSYSNQRNSDIPAGYTYSTTYVGKIADSNKVSSSDSRPVWKYTTENGQTVWHTGYSTGTFNNRNNANGSTEVYMDDSNTPSLITDIYYVFTKNKPDLNVHYIYIDSSGNLHKLDKADAQIASKDIGTSAETATRIDPGQSGTTTAPLKIEENSKTYEYSATRIGPTWATTLTKDNLGPNVQQVYLKDGTPMYYTSNSMSLSYLRANTWSYDSSDGRRFVINRSGTAGQYNYSLTDSRHGTVTLNYTAENTYTASFHGEAQTTEYSYNPTTRLLTVKDWLPNSLTDVYEIYTDTTNSKIWIDDDLKYSGYLKTGISDELSGSDVTNKTYTWYKTVTDSSGNTTTEPVSRKLTGEHYNIEYSPSQRTWLDLEADEGGLNTTTQTAVSYYVELSYTKDGGTHTVRSNTIDIQYYSDLMNGSFEKPKKAGEGAVATTKNPAGRDTGDYSNADYKANGGVWQTTGVGTGTNRWITGSNEWRSNVNADIEIINISDKQSVADSYRFSSASAVTTPDGGSQFAELNAEAAGALYQDVVTHPNQQLHYWFAHRARGWMDGKSNHGGAGSGTTPEYDTMYVVIMPTKLAMTSGSDGGELRTQEDLVSFISSHGGYDSSLADGIEEEITYKEDSDGIVILKVSSSDQAWHNVTMLNNYIAKAGLTRFFFAAGPTAYQNDPTEGAQEKINPTHGNFIDGIGFSQDLPTPEGFNLVVTKTFSGLSEKQVASMANASTATDVTANTIDPFKITITDNYWDKNTNAWTTDENRKNKALNGAVLGYSVSGSEGSYTFTPTATLNGKNLLTGDNTSSVKRNDDGTLTITWTFMDQALADNTNDDVTDRTYYYYVDESGAGVTGYSLNPTVSNTYVHVDDAGNSTTASNSHNYRSLGKKDSVTFELTNTYKDNASSDQPQMYISKTFSGVTPSTVDAMLGAGYQLQVTKGSNTLTLQGNEAAPVKRDADESDELAKLTVSLTKTTNTDSSTTLTWLIEGWGDGTYTISETGTGNSVNTLTKVLVNGKTDGVSDIKTEPITKSGISVGSGAAATLHFGSETGTAATDGKVSATTLASNTNLVIGQYTTSDSAKHYVVWTPATLGANTSQAVLNKINSLWTDAGATISNTEFHSAENPGTISQGSGAGTFVYDSSNHQFSLTTTNAATLSWNNYYSTRYWVGNSEKDSGVYNATDITVENDYNPVIHIQKVDSNDATKLLSGAEFKIFKKDGESRKYYYADGATDDAKWVEASNASVYKTGDGKNNTTLGIADLPKDLPAGTYYLEESKAPDGYNRNTKPAAFVVNSNRTVNAATVTEGKVDGIDVDTDAMVEWNSPYYVITVKDSVGTILPNTGGMGTRMFWIIGATLVLFAGYMLYRRKRSLATYNRLMDEIHSGGSRTGSRTSGKRGDRR